MLDGSTYKAGAEQGFSGLDFYAAGRAGVLGRLDPAQVSASFGFFEPGAVAGWLEQAGAVMAPQEASAAFMACGYDWADQHLGDDVDWVRLSELLAKAIAAAPDDGLPLFRAWREAPEPDRGAKALALHRFNVLRELRNELHVAAVAQVGLQPLEALLVKTPHMAPLFGWAGELPEVGDEQRAKHEQAEAETNRWMAPAFEGLDEAERDELVTLADAAVASIT
jgi:hypothetical protein